MPLRKEQLHQFAVDLFNINAIKFGEFKTKIGIMTPVYFDLRVIVSYPKLMETVANLFVDQLNQSKISNTNLICGVPYTALPIATVVSLKTEIPMVMRRKEAKDHGTKKCIEGVFSDGDTCIIIEDVVTSGSSILETVNDLRKEGMKCTDAFVLLNREQGGESILEKNGIKMHALFSLSELISVLKEEKCINEEMVQKVRQYLKDNQVNSSMLEKPVPTNRLKLSFSERAKQAKNPIASKLFQVMVQKQTTLCLAADVTDATDLLNLAEEVGPFICALKTHIDIVEDFNSSLIKPLKDIAERHNFLLFEDRKFADIGKTVELQYSKGVYNISSWASIVTAHSVTGKGVLDAIKGSPGLSERGVFLLAETSASGSLITEDYTKSTLKLASDYPDLIVGIVCQSPLFLDSPGMIQLTPGVQLETKSDNLGQQYNTPELVVTKKGADVAVVGRGITMASDRVKAAQKYRDCLWSAYLNRLEKK